LDNHVSPPKPKRVGKAKAAAVDKTPAAAKTKSKRSRRSTAVNDD
jgi:hypothetical protein